MTSPLARSNSRSDKVIEARAAAGQQAQVVTTRGERADDVRADEPAPAGDQSLAHVPMVEAAEALAPGPLRRK